MQNRKFRKKEEAIFLAYYCLRDYPSVKIIAKRAKISRSTFYRHHKAPHSIPSDYKNYLLSSFSCKISPLLKKKEPPMQLIFLRALVFIHGNRNVIRILFIEGHKEVVADIIDRIKVQLLVGWHYSCCSDRFYQVYKNEIVGIIEVWAGRDFAIDGLGEALDDILFLTQTAPKRLARFLESSK